MSGTDPRSAERSFYDDTDYADVDLEPADDVEVARQPAPRSTFALRLDGSTIGQLREVARRRGTRPTQLAREWLVERLAHEGQGPSEELGLSPLSPGDDKRQLSEVLRNAADQVREALERRAVSEEQLDGRMSALERSFEDLKGFVPLGAMMSSARDSDLVAELEARARVARELFGRLGAAGSVEAPTHAGADLVVRHGDRTWVIEIKQSSADLTSSVRHVLEAGKRLNGRPVLVVVAQPAQTDIVALSKSSGVLVTRPDEMDGLLAEIAEEPPRVSSAG